MHRSSIALAVASIAGAAVAQAQGGTLAAPYYASSATPIGAVSPVLSSQMLGTARQGTDFRVQYGYLGQDGRFNQNDVAAGMDFPWGNGALGATVGWTQYDCGDADCKGNIMVGVDWERRIVSAQIGTGLEAARMTLGVDATAGFAAPDEDTWALGGSPKAYTLSLGMPIAFVPGGSGRKLVPFVTPRFLHGRIMLDNGGDSGASFMLGGGLAILDAVRGVDLTVGFQKLQNVFANGMFGVGATWRGSR